MGRLVSGEEIQEGEQCGPELGDGVGKKGPQEAPWEVEEGQAQMVRRREHHEWVNACFFLVFGFCVFRAPYVCNPT